MRLLTLMCAIVVCTASVASAETPWQRKHKWRMHKREEVARKLDRGLQGTPLSGLGHVLEQVGWRYRLHPAFIAGASGTESTFGAAPCCGQRFNIWGWYGMPRVNSWEEAFIAYARWIQSRWSYPRDPWSLPGYCGCGTTAWGNRTSYFMHRLGFSSELRYPRR